MRLANLMWAWVVTTAVGVVNVLAVGKVRQQREERYLNYENLPRVTMSNRHSTHNMVADTLSSSSKGILSGSLLSRDTLSIPGHRSSSLSDRNDRHKVRQRSQGLASDRKYSSVRSNNKRKADRRKDKRKDTRMHNSSLHAKTKTRLHNHSLHTMSKHISVAEPKRSPIVRTSIQDIAGTWNNVNVPDRRTMHSFKQKRPGVYGTSRGSSGTETPTLPVSRKQTKPTIIPGPYPARSILGTANSHWKTLRKVPQTLSPTRAPQILEPTRAPQTMKGKNSAKKGSSTLNRYPYSTTFQSFDHFLKSMGTSLKLVDGSHAIRPRSDAGSDTSGRAFQDLELERTGRNGYRNDQSSRDLYETNSLGIDVFEHDKATLLNMPERCCGSKVPLDLDNAKVTGGFSRVAAAGSIKVVAVPDKDTDLLPPSGIRDLRSKVREPKTIVLTWTTPGDDLDFGTVSRYVIRLSDTRYNLRERRFDQAASGTELNLDDLLEASGVFQEAGARVEVVINVDENVPKTLYPGQQYYLAMKAMDDYNNTSPVSNVATFTLPLIPETTTTTTTTSTTTTTTTTPPPATTTTAPTTTTTTTTTPPPTTTTTTPTTTTTTTTPPPTTTTTTPTTTTTTTTPPPTTTTTTTEPPTTTVKVYKEIQTVIQDQEDITNTLVSHFGTENNNPEPVAMPTATLVGRVVSNSAEEEEPNKRKKSRKGKGKRRKNRKRKGKKSKRNKNENTSKEQQPASSSNYDPYKYVVPGCHDDNGHKVTDGKLCDAISALLTVIDYFEQTREYKHLDYLSSIAVTLRHRAQPHWRRTRHVGV